MLISLYLKKGKKEGKKRKKKRGVNQEGQIYWPKQCMCVYLNVGKMRWRLVRIYDLIIYVDVVTKVLSSCSLTFHSALKTYNPSIAFNVIYYFYC